MATILFHPSALVNKGCDFSEDSTKDSGPNGNITFINCGIDGNGWDPANVTVDQRKLNLAY